MNEQMSVVLGTVAMEPKGEYSSEAYYEKLNTVLYNDSTYIAIKPSHNILPTDTEYWQLIGGGAKKEEIIQVFDTVADMKLADLKEEMTVQTLGYYEANDGGVATYKITDEESETDYQEELENGLYATLIIKDSATPEQFGAKGDGVTDDINAMLNVFKYNRLIVFSKNKNYLITQPVVIYKGTSVEMSGSTLTAQDTTTGNHLFHNFLTSDTYLGYEGNGNIIVRNGIMQKGSIDLIHGENILFENISFEDCRRDHYFEICACKNVTIRDCSFVEMNSGNPSRKEYINIDNCTYSNFPWFNENSPTYDGTIVDGVLIDNCLFDRNNTEMQDAVGKHSYYDETDHSLNKSKNIMILNSKVIGATDCAFYFLGAENVIIDNCSSLNCKNLYRISDCEQFKISNNKATNLSDSNRITKSNKINIISNDIETNSNIWDLIIYDVCDEINYSYNKYKNTNSGRLPIYVGQDANITKMNILSNNYTVFNNTGAKGVIALDNTNNSQVKFENVDDLSFSNIVQSTTVTNSQFDLTNFNYIVFSIGFIGQHNWQEITIKSFTGRNFLVGEIYRFIYIDVDGSVKVDTITITDEHTITSSVVPMRSVQVKKLPKG